MSRADGKTSEAFTSFSYGEELGADEKALLLGILGAQATLTLGTGVAAALALNIGSVGAPVVYNGAGGTPSAIVLTNGTGLPIAGITGLGGGVATALAVSTGNTGALVLYNGVASFSSLTVSGATLYGSGMFVTETTAARTLTSADNGKVILCTNASAVAIALNTGLPSYFACTIRQKGAGVVTVSGTATREIPSGYSAKTNGQHTQISVDNSGVTDTYQISGNLGA